MDPTPQGPQAPKSKLKKFQPSTILQFAFSPSATCVSASHSTVKFAEFLGKPPQANSGEKVITGESVPTLMRPLLVPSPVCKEIQSALGGIPSGDYHGPSKASLTGQRAGHLLHSSHSALWAEPGRVRLWNGSRGTA